MTEITNEELISGIEEGSNYFTHKIFTEWVTLPNKRFNRSMSFINSVFRAETIKFDGCHFWGLDMTNTFLTAGESPGKIFLCGSHFHSSEDKNEATEVKLCNAIIVLNKAKINTKVYFPDNFFGDVILDGASLGERGQIFCGNNVLLALKCFLYFGKKVHVDLNCKFDLGAFKK